MEFEVEHENFENRNSTAPAGCCREHTGTNAARKIKITGKLVRMMAIGGESTGWAVQLDEPRQLEGKELRSVLAKFSDPKEGEKYVDKKVKVKGTIGHHHGVETGDTAVIDVESIKKLKEPKPAA
jgi:hypothetical protein